MALGASLKLDTPAGDFDSREWTWTIDCTFCALESENVDRYEPCITGILYGPTVRAITIMDGPFPSIYPWDEAQHLNSLTSALYTPLDKCATWEDARKVLAKTTVRAAQQRVEQMMEQLAAYWPDITAQYKIHSWKFGIRAMPRSAAAARIVDVVRVSDRLIRVRAGKIDAVFQAQALVEEIIGES